MEKEFTKEELLEIEKQLSCPTGEFGLEMGENMNETNITMTLSGIDFLDIADNNSVLELGHGNCGHLPQILNKANGVNYFGLEISETMKNVAEKNNASPIAKFQLYDGENIPFSTNAFERVMSVNTVYFWKNPEKLINEIERVLKPNGICVLVYASKEFMAQLPFVGEKFKLFGQEEMKNLIQFSSLEIVGFKDETEQAITKTGSPVERKFSLVKVKKVSL